MTVQVIFFKTAPMNQNSALAAVGEITAREAVTIPGTTSRALAAGESVAVYNGESSAVLVAHGATPDATATTATALTSCGYPVPASGVSPPIQAAAGEKISVKAVP